MYRAAYPRQQLLGAARLQGSQALSFSWASFSLPSAASMRLRGRTRAHRYDTPAHAHRTHTHGRPRARARRAAGPPPTIQTAAVVRVQTRHSDPVLRTGQIVFALTQRLDAYSHFTQDCLDGIWPDLARLSTEYKSLPPGSAENDSIGAVIL